ncbi:MAG: redoxin domain-containing protein [Planctomycetes bacterium]|nr:redoxin domain-containing protein [Planctomycetota bacterium]
MSRPVLAAWLLLWTAGSVLAQQGEPKPAAQQDARAAHQQLTEALQKAIADWQQAARKAVQEAQAAGKPIPAIAMEPPVKPFVERAQALAEQHAGTDAAVPFLVFVITNANREHDAVRAALKALWADHSAGTAIGPVLAEVTSAYFQHDAQKEVDDLLNAVVEDNDDADTKALALVARGNLRLQTAEDDKARAAAAADIRKVAALTQNAKILQQAKDALFEIENLQVGCTAPDIVAKDTDGVPFKLSDYRGKVVLLDFWGFW